MKCKLCIEAGQPEHFGSEIGCAFDGEFTDNWNCSTLGKLRVALAGGDDWGRVTDSSLIKTFVREDQTTVLVDLRFMDWEKMDDNEVTPDSMFVTWYKRRGRTEQVFLMYDDQEPRQPTESQVLDVVAYINSKESGHE